MTITITDGTTALTLSPYLLTPDKANIQQAAGSERVTLGRRLVVNRLPGTGGNKIHLQAVNDNGSLRGSFTWSQAGKFRSWSDAGTVLTLSIHGALYLGVIPLDGVDIAPVTPKTNQPDASLCTGTLTLMET